MTRDAGLTLKAARMKAGLSQRSLARLAATSQPLISRIERGLTIPTTAGLSRLLEAAGFRLRLEVEDAPVVDTHMLADIERILSLTPEERLVELANFSRFEREVKYGVSVST